MKDPKQKKGQTMKNKVFHTFLLLSFFFMLSCSEDFTLLAPYSERKVENFYKTAEAIPEEYYGRVGRDKPAAGEGEY